MELRINSDYFSIQLQLSGFYNRHLNCQSPVVTIYTTSIKLKIPRSPHTVYLWILCGTEKKKGLYSLYIINCLDFVTEIKHLNPSVKICTTSLTFNNSTFFLHSVFICFVWIWELAAIISFYSINWLVFITDI
jgi:hypothetical protein